MILKLLQIKPQIGRLEELKLKRNNKKLNFRTGILKQVEYLFLQKSLHPILQTEWAD